MGWRLPLIFILAALAAPGLAQAGTFTVNGTGDANVRNEFLSIREAILIANHTLVGPFTTQERAQLSGCTFDGGGHITGGCGFHFDTIRFSVDHVDVTQWLPALDAQGTWVQGSAGSPRIDGHLVPAGTDALVVRDRDVTISGLSFVNFSSAGGVDIDVIAGPNVRIAHNYVGTVPAAATGPVTNCTPALPGGGSVTRNAPIGISIYPGDVGSAASGDAVAYVYGNTVGCSSGHGVIASATGYLRIGRAPDDSEVGNLVGVNAAGASLPNSIGIRVANSHDVTIDGGQSSNNQWGIFLEHLSSSYVRHVSVDHSLHHGITIQSGSHGVGVFNATVTRSGGAGVLIKDPGTYGNYVTASRIGTADGTLPQRNDTGVVITNSAHGNYVGYRFLGNLISGNLHGGVLISNLAYANVVESNKIGTNADGTWGLSNFDFGVGITTGAALNLLGPETSNDRPNLISTNGGDGVTIQGASTVGNRVDANRIGTNWDGTTGLENGNVGISMYGAGDDNVIGRAGSSRTQLISGNHAQGIYVLNTNHVRIVDNNRIGVNASGTALGNGAAGIRLDNSSDDFVDPLVLRFNAGPGIGVNGTSQRDTILPGFVSNNGGLGIDLATNGHTANDSGDADSGPNTLLNYPVIDASSPSGVGATITGTTCSSCWVHIYGAIGNTFGNGGGGYHLFAVQADKFGNWHALLPKSQSKSTVAAIANDPGGNSSELGPRG
ncbi:MAG: hypothetical protein QOE36_955 [Gaiellaceae bacterium]|nr:hypothetical protein [Gaiellaceae bacterium]